MRKSLLVIAVLVAGVAGVTHAQMAHRLKGSLRGTGGAPIANAKVRADNLSGFRGEPFAGQKEQEVTSSDKGEWNITGIEAGLWLFSTRTPDTIPAVIVMAKTIFSLALQQAPKHPRAMLGAAMASLLGRDWETAGKQIWDARDLVPKEQRQALAAAIDDLRGIARVQ